MLGWGGVAGGERRLWLGLRIGAAPPRTDSDRFRGVLGLGGSHPVVELAQQLSLLLIRPTLLLCALLAAEGTTLREQSQRRPLPLAAACEGGEHLATCGGTPPKNTEHVKRKKAYNKIKRELQI